MAAPVLQKQVCAGCDEKLAHAHVTSFGRQMQWALLSEDKDEDYNVQNKSNSTNARSNACTGVVVVLSVFGIHIRFRLDEKPAHFQMTRIR